MVKYQAKPYIAAAPQAEVSGQSVLAFSENLESCHITEILPRHGFGRIEPQEWYPQQCWMDVLQEISTWPDASPMLVAFGRKNVENAAIPAEINDVPKMLSLLHKIHHQNLRNIPDDEGFCIKQLSEKHFYIYHNTPNPDSAVFGFLWGLAARFKKADERFMVRMIPNPNPEEEPGTIFEMRWD